VAGVEGVIAGGVGGPGVEAGGAHSFGYHYPGVDGFDSDFARTELLGGGSGDGIHLSFCRGLTRGSRQRPRRDLRADVYNVSASVVAILDRFLRGEEQPKDIHVKVFVELFLGDLFKWRPVVNSGIVDQKIDLAESLLCCGKESFDFRFLGDVRPYGDRFAAALLMPAPMLRADMTRAGKIDAPALARRYAVTEQALWIQLIDLRATDA